MWLFVPPAPPLLATTGGVNGSMELFGTAAGEVAVDLVWYTAAGCSQPVLAVHVAGTFSDLGQLAADGQDLEPTTGAAVVLRKFAFNISAARTTVTPLSAVGAVSMAALCPCKGSALATVSPWAVDRTTTVSTCDHADWNLTFLGGIRFDEPVFAVVSLSANGGLAVGQMDSDPQIGFSNTGLYLRYPVPAQRCTSSSTPGSFCGTFATANTSQGGPCEVMLHPWTDAIDGSKVTEFSFRGLLPPGADPPFPGTHGVYNRTTKYFSDTKCLIHEATVSEEGSIGFCECAHCVGFRILMKNPANLHVTPSSTARGWGTVASLAESCACGQAADAWRVDAPRTITSCPVGRRTCVRPIFNDHIDPGSVVYAHIVRNSTSLGARQTDSLLFDGWAINPDAVGPMGTRTSAMVTTHRPVADDVCVPSVLPTSLCGAFAAQCSISRIEYDAATTVVLTGSTEPGSSEGAEGRIFWSQTLFSNTGGGCAEGDEAIEIGANGVYSLGSSATAAWVGGVSLINISFTSGFAITPVVADMVVILSSGVSGCPCGGQWALNVTRTLKGCPANSCAGFWTTLVLPGGGFGRPGFGVVQLNAVDRVLRLSQLSSDPVAGHAKTFDDETTLLRQVASCPEATHPAPHPATTSSIWTPTRLPTAHTPPTASSSSADVVIVITVCGIGGLLAAAIGLRIGFR